MTSLETLTTVCPPPPASAVPEVDWRAVEETVRTELPGDYKKLASRYGPGAFGDFIRIYHPAAPTRWVDLTGPAPAAIRAQLERDAESAAFRPPHEPRQLFPMGVTDNGNYLFWVTDPEDRPGAWRVAVNEARGPEWYTHDGNLTDFLAGVLSGQLTVPLFPSGLLDGGVAFTPSVPSVPSVPAHGSDPPQARPPAGGAPAATGDVRAWARANGYDVPDRGRVPADIIDKWKEATQ